MALDSVGYYALPIIPTFKGIERGISSKIKTTFGKTGTDAGKLMGDNVAKGLASARGKVDTAASKHAKSLDKVKTASGQARVEIQRLNEAINKGVGGSRLTAQTERTAAALRREAAAAREAKTAETQLSNARRTLSSQQAPGGGMAQATGQAVQGGGSTAIPIAGKMGGLAGGAFMAGLGAVVSVAAVGALFKSALDTGVDFERSVNMFGGVTASGAEGMERMRQAARDLGTDTKLAGVSARDAGNAMVELAKGGLSADEAMQAARGTLQLATAGQLDAADAAKYQSAVLNTWQLDATNATRVADLLAAGANASAADVSDLGQAMQQGGAVAAGFGVNVEDTVTALTLFSKWGINGSDAGTMLKTSLQAITDQGNPAQGAIEELGLKLYDANHEFVGVESMMKQVGEASKRMTQEQFQAATAVLFGSDAMRASMVAANGGAEAWDATAEAVTRQGAAADMAAANMQGLPGIIESLSNVWEGFKLKLFDVIDGPLIAIGNWFLDFISGGGGMGGAGQVLGALGDAFRGIGEVVGQYLMPALKQLWDNIKGPLIEYGKQWVDTFKSAMPVLKAVGVVIGAALLGAIKGLSITLPILIKGMTAVITVAKGVYTAIAGGISIVTSVAQAIGGALVGAWNLAKAAIGAAWSVIKPVVDGFMGALRFLGEAARYAFDTVIIPMWHNLQTVAGAAWSLVKPIFDAMGAAWGAVAGVAMDFWQGTIVPVWEGVKAAFAAGWAGIQPVFEQIKGAFQGVKDFVGGVWSGLAGVVKAALDGVISAVKGPLRWIGGVLAKVPLSIGPIEIPGAQAARDLGSTLQGLRAGTDRRGVLFGPGSGTSDSILGIDAKTGRPTAFVSAGEGVVRADAMRGGGGPIVAALNAGWVPSADLLHSMLPGYKRGTGDKGVLTEDEIARMGGGTVNASILEALRAVNPSAKLTSAKTDHDADGGFHPRGQAIDVDPSSANLDALWAMRDKLTQIIYDDPDKVWYNVGGQRAEGAAARAIYGESTMAQHGDHIHVAAADLVSPPSGRRRRVRGGGNLPSLADLPNDAGPEDIARHIAAEGIRRGYSEDEIVAAISAGLKESGLDAQVTNATGHKGIFQMDAAKPGRDTARGQIEWFYGMLDKLGGPGGLGDPFATIADKVEIGGYSGASLANEQQGNAQALYDKVAGDLTVESPDVNVDVDASTTNTDTGAGGEQGPQLSELGSIGKQFLSDTFGFGDLLPDPAELGIVKLASALMGIKYTPQGKGFPWQTGYAGGTGEPFSGNPFAATGAEGLGGGGGAGAALGGLIPGVNIPPPPEGDQHMPGGAPAGVPVAPGPIDQSTNITIQNPQGDENSIADRTRRVILRTPRLGTYSGPTPGAPR